MKRERGSLRVVTACLLTLAAVLVAQAEYAYGEIEAEREKTGVTCENNIRETQKEDKEVKQSKNVNHSCVWIVVVSIVLLGAVYVLLNDHFYKKNKRDEEEKRQKRLKII